MTDTQSILSAKKLQVEVVGVGDGKEEADRHVVHAANNDVF